MSGDASTERADLTDLRQGQNATRLFDAQCLRQDPEKRRAEGCLAEVDVTRHRFENRSTS
jgi:hypothetical protein